MTNKKIENLDALRGIAALGVCIVHNQLFSEYKSGTFIDTLIVHGQLGVQLFFIISGFILPYSLYNYQYQFQNFFKFLLKRSLRIEPPFWAAIFLIITILYFNQPIDIKKLLSNMFYLVPFVKETWYDSAFWTLGVEIQYYIILGLTFPLLMRTPVLYRVGFLVLLFQIIIFNDLESRNFIVGNLTYFILGFIAFLVHAKLIDRKIGLILLTALCIELSFIVAIRLGLISLIGLTVILIIKPIKSKTLTFFGTISFSLYLVHDIIGSTSREVLARLGFNPLACFLSQIFIVILVSIIFYWCFEKPSMRLSKKLSFQN